MSLPEPHTIITLTTADGLAVRARVERCHDGVLALRTSAAAASPGWAAGEAVTLRWPAGARGRYTVAGTVCDGTGAVVHRPDAASDEAGDKAGTDVDGPDADGAGTRLAVSVTATPALEQVRRFVRGGGGEQIWARAVGSAVAVNGRVQDISEQGVRARFEGSQAQPGQEAVLLIELEDESVEVTATVLESRADDKVEVVFAFEPAEPQAQAIRRHVLRRQMRARARARAVEA